MFRRTKLPLLLAQPDVPADLLASFTITGSTLNGNVADATAIRTTPRQLS